MNESLNFNTFENNDDLSFILNPNTNPNNELFEFDSVQNNNLVGIQSRQNNFNNNTLNQEITKNKTLEEENRKLRLELEKIKRMVNHNKENELREKYKNQFYATKVVDFKYREIQKNKENTIQKERKHYVDFVSVENQKLKELIEDNKKQHQYNIKKRENELKKNIDDITNECKNKFFGYF